MGNCEYEVDKVSLSDEAKVLYTEKVNTMSCDVKGIPVRTTSVPSPSQTRLSQGWDLKQGRSKSVCSRPEKNIYKTHSTVGKIGRKMDQYRVLEMRALSSAKNVL